MINNPLRELNSGQIWGVLIRGYMPFSIFTISLYNSAKKCYNISATIFSLISRQLWLTLYGKGVGFDYYSYTITDGFIEEKMCSNI